MAASPSQSFGPTGGGLVTGWFAGALLGILGLWLASADLLGIGALLLGVAFTMWCFLARPRVLIHDDRLELRNAFSSWFVPLGSVEDVAVGHATVVTAGGGQYVGDGVGRSTMEVVRGEGRRGMADRMIEAIRHEASRSTSTGEVSRTYAIPHLVVIAVLLVAFVAF